MHTAGLKCVCSSVVPLGKYYATYARRAEWQDTWRQEMSKGEKLQVRENVVLILFVNLIVGRVHRSTHQLLIELQ